VVVAQGDAAAELAPGTRGARTKSGRSQVQHLSFGQNSRIGTASPRHTVIGILIRSGMQ